MPFQIIEPTYGFAIQTIARQVGHPVPTDAAGSSDPAVIQMGAAINTAMRELLAMREWQDVTVRDTISVVADSAGQKEKAFDLPADFYRFINQTQWSGSSLFPAMGPVSNQAWMGYVVRNWVMELSLYWQMRGDQVWFLNPPFPDPAPFEFMYISRAQVIDADDATLLKNFADKNGDKFRLDANLVALLGRVRYLEWKGFDAAPAMRDFLSAYSSRAGAADAAPVLSISRSFGTPLLSPLTNVPDTGFGR